MNREEWRALSHIAGLFRIESQVVTFDHNLRPPFPAQVFLTISPSFSFGDDKRSCGAVSFCCDGLRTA